MDLEERKSKAREVFSAYLKSKNGRFTTERKIILDLISVLKTKFTIEQVETMLAEQGELISRATLYNTIHEMEAARMLKKNQFGKAAHFQFCSGKMVNFTHVCIQCGRIQDFQNLELESMLGAYRNRRFSIEEIGLTFRGLCSNCLTKNRKKEKRLLNKKNNES